MDAGSLFVIFLRLIIPVTILRYPVGGFAAAYLLDGLHIPLLEIFNGWTGFGEGAFAGWKNYHLLDKWLDIYFLSFALMVVFKWKNVFIARTSLVLYLLRLAGIIVFSFTAVRSALFFFPNVFDVFYAYLVVSRKWFKKVFPDSKTKVIMVAFLAVAFKFPFEYLLHVKGWGLGTIISSFTPFRISAPTIWEWVKSLAR